ncbi:hypothetical protein D3C72_1318970 [compost metagenome]
MFRAAVVVVVRQCPLTADGLRPMAVVQHVAVQIDGAVAAADIHAGVDVPDVVDHALVLVLVPRHHLADFLHPRLDAGLTGERDEQQGEGEAVGALVLPDLADGVGRIGVVLQVQTVLAEDHFHQRLQALVTRVAAVDHLLLQHLAHRRRDREHLFGRRHAGGGDLYGGDGRDGGRRSRSILRGQGWRAEHSQ